MLLQRLWVWAFVESAYADLPPPLSRRDGREADVINGSLSPLPTSASLSNPSRLNTNRMSGSLLIEHLARQGNHATVSPSLEEHFSVFIRLENGKMKPRLRGSHVFSREKGGDWCPVLGGNIIRGKYYY